MMNSGQVSASCVVDTDMVIEVLRRRSYARTMLERWAERGTPGVSAITYLEVYRGMKAGEEDSTAAFLNDVVSIPMDASLARRAGLLLRDLRSHGLTIGIADAVVAATALTLDVPLLTNNVRHYIGIPGLEVVKGAPG